MTTELLDAPKTESSVMAKYQITKEQIKKAVETASLVTVEGPEDKKGMAVARENRLSLQKMRTTIEAKRKELKADALAYGRKVDSVAKELTAIITPEEQRLKELEETAAREAERLAELEKQAREVENKRRCDLLAKIGVMVPVIELQFMDAVAFEAFYLGKKADFDAAKKAEEEAEAARKAEADRLAKVAEEQAAQAAEIARQQAELAKKQAEQQAELDRQKAEIEAKQKAIEDAEREKREKCLGWRTSQLALVNATMDQDEMMALTDEDFDALVAVKRKEDEKRKAAEAKAEAFRKEQEAKAAAEEAARIAALAPDREKIDAYINAFSDVELPVLSSKIVEQRVAQLADDFADDLRQLMVELEKGTL